MHKEHAGAGTLVSGVQAAVIGADDMTDSELITGNVCDGLAADTGDTGLCCDLFGFVKGAPNNFSAPSSPVLIHKPHHSKFQRHTQWCIKKCSICALHRSSKLDSFGNDQPQTLQ